MTEHSETVQKALQTFEAWQNAVASGDNTKVVALYSDDSVLLPTLEGEICSDKEGQLKYFKHFCEQHPKCTVTELSTKEIEGGFVVLSGHYNFDFDKNPSAHARFSFIMRQNKDGSMDIIDHHSSLNPDEAAGKQWLVENPAVHKNEELIKQFLSQKLTLVQPGDAGDVQQALRGWFNSVVIGTPEQVVKCYREDADLVPTLSGKFCNSPEKIQDYMTDFSSQHPDGRVYALHTRVYGNFAVNTGHYAFRMPNNDLVLARFMFAYARKPDTSGAEAWKIVTHHSSLNPDGLDQLLAPKLEPEAPTAQACSASGPRKCGC